MVGPCVLLSQPKYQKKSKKNQNFPKNIDIKKEKGKRGIEEVHIENPKISCVARAVLCFVSVALAIYYTSFSILVVTHLVLGTR